MESNVNLENKENTQQSTYSYSQSEIDILFPKFQ